MFESLWWRVSEWFVYSVWGWRCDLCGARRWGLPAVRDHLEVEHTAEELRSLLRGAS